MKLILLNDGKEILYQTLWTLFQPPLNTSFAGYFLLPNGPAATKAAGIACGNADDLITLCLKYL